MTKNEHALVWLMTKYRKALIADMAGVSRQAVQNWKKVPLAYVIPIAEKTGLRPEDILPDPYAME